MMARLRRAGGWRDWSAVAAVLALILQMGVAVAHDPLSVAIGGWLEAPLCHAISTTDGGNAPQKPVPCPICLGLAAGSAALLPLPPPDGIVLTPHVYLLQIPLTASLRRTNAARSTAQPRAPPALI